MAEFLVMRSNYWYDVGEISAKDTLGETKFDAGVHRKWDSLRVADDGHFLDMGEVKGKSWDHDAFFVIQAIGITAQFAKQYTGPLLDMASLEAIKPTVIRNRWSFASLPTATKDQIEADGYLKTEWVIVSPYLVGKTI